MENGSVTASITPKRGPIMDAHCHLSHPAMMPFAETFVKHALAHGIDGFILGGTDPQEWLNQEQLQRQFPGMVHQVLGIHPWQVAGLTTKLAATWLDILAQKAPQCRGIGEIGLDRGNTERKGAFSRQMEVCESQLALAAKFGKPVVLHAVRAHQELLSLLRRWRATGGREPSPGPTPHAVIHGFHGSKQLAAQYLDTGVHISLGLRLLTDAKDDMLIRFIPADRLVIESDSPQKRSGPINSHPDATLAINDGWYTSPSAIVATATAIGQIRGLHPQELLRQCGHNLALIFFGSPDRA